IRTQEMKSNSTQQEEAPTKVSKKKESKKAKIDTAEDDRELTRLPPEFSGISQEGSLVYVGVDAADQMRQAIKDYKGKKRLEIVVLYDSHLQDKDVESAVAIKPFCFCSSVSPDLTDKSLELLSGASNLDRLELEDSQKFTPEGLKNLY